jgi:hypothetical protein
VPRASVIRAASRAHRIRCGSWSVQSIAVRVEKALYLGPWSATCGRTPCR